MKWGKKKGGRKKFSLLLLVPFWHLVPFLHLHYDTFALDDPLQIFSILSTFSYVLGVA